MDKSKNRVSLRVWGEAACFTRPEMKAERVSYDIMTPSAARGILEAVYWKPEIRWVVERISVLAPIRFGNVRRNEVGQKGPGARTLKSYMSGEKSAPLAQYADDRDTRQQRAALILLDVEYLVEAYYEVLNGSDPPQKHYEMFKRRAEKGQCFHHPYLGCREFAAHFAWHSDEPPEVPSELRGERDLGWMLHDIDFADQRTPRFFRAMMRDGIVEVPAFESGEVRA